MSWFKKATRKAIRFFHETDLNNLYSIATQGIKPSGGQLGFDDWGRPEMRFFGAYFGKDEQSTSHGYDTQINRKIMLQGWLPVSFLQEHGEADADYIYRKENWFSSRFYPNAPYGEEDDEITYKINPKTKQWEPENEPFTWDKSYWQKPYGAASVKTTIPFDWVENIRVGRKWYPKKQIVSLLGKTLNNQKKEYEDYILRTWKNWDKQNKLFSFGPNLPVGDAEYIEDVSEYVDRLHKEYLTIKHLLTEDEIKTTEVLFDMKKRMIDEARTKAKTFYKDIRRN